MSFEMQIGLWASGVIFIWLVCHLFKDSFKDPHVGVTGAEFEEAVKNHESMGRAILTDDVWRKVPERKSNVEHIDWPVPYWIGSDDQKAEESTKNKTAREKLEGLNAPHLGAWNGKGWE